MGARELIGRAVEEELRVFLEQQAGRREANGRLAVVRNGYQPEGALPWVKPTMSLSM